MISLAELFSFIALSHLLLLLWLMWRERRSEKNVGVPLFFGCTIAGYLVADSPFLEQFPAVHLPLLVLPFLAPAAFWLFSKWIFDDGFRWQGWWLGPMAAVVAVFYFLFLQNKFQVFPMWRSLQIVCGLSSQLISLTFILLGILEATRNRESDLVLSRLKFRTVFIAATALLMAVTALVEISLAGAEAPPGLAVLQKAAIAALTVFFAANRLLIKPGFFPENEKNTPPQTLGASPEPPEIDAQLLEKLADFMQRQQIWRSEGLTIRQLAEKMEVKEYRLRQAINQHLGFRNFNDYLHAQRIREACAMLADPARRELTVLEIAYQLGYASLAPFNKAFRELTGTTPTDWRRQHLI